MLSDYRKGKFIDMNKVVIWKRFRDYQYLVSNRGEILNFNTGNQKKKSIDTYGYEVTTFFKNGKRRQFKVHRLVAELFVKDFDLKLDVNHIDGNKLNNHYSNLEWVTSFENTRHAIENGLHINKLTKEDVLDIRRKVVKHCRVNGVIPLSRKYGVNEATIRRVVNNKTWDTRFYEKKG